jgi:HEAT repeat protein
MRNNRLLFVHGATCALALFLAPASRGADKTLDPDEQLLKEAKIGTDNASLLAYLRAHSDKDDDLLHPERLIEQLGSAKFNDRELAGKKLLALELSALPALRAACKNQDLEIAKRAKACVKQIEKETRRSLALSAVKTIVKREALGSLEVLLRYLPFAVDEAVEKEIYYGLESLAIRDNKLDTALIKALADPLPARRAVAGCLVARLGNAEQRRAAVKLLRDKDAIVRLRAAQGLLAANEKAGIPALIELLEQPSVNMAHPKKSATQHRK